MLLSILHIFFLSSCFIIIISSYQNAHHDTWEMLPRMRIALFNGDTTAMTWRCGLSLVTLRSFSVAGEAVSLGDRSGSKLDKLKGIDARTGKERVGRNFNYKMELTTLAQRLGYGIKNLPSLQNALVHKSAMHEDHADSVDHNGRLAVLGKATLVHYIMEYLFYTYPNMDGRSLFDICLELTHHNTLSELNNHLGITELLLTTVDPSDLRYRSVLSRSFTAVLGALYHDQGPLAARKMVQDIILPILKTTDIRDCIKLQNPASVLNEILKMQGKPPAEARLIRESGRLSHFPTFVVGVFSDGQMLGEGTGTSLKRAKREAMAAAIRKHYMKELRNVSLPSDKDKTFQALQD